MLARICIHTLRCVRVHAHTHSEEKKEPKSLEKEQTQGPGIAEPS